MADMMMFPDTVEEFMEQYKMVDKEQIYSNGIEYVPIFRMKQWFEHVSDTDTISRQAAIDALDVGKELLSRALDNMDIVGNVRERFEWGLGLIESCIEDIKEIPYAQPERKKGRWIVDEEEESSISGSCSACGWQAHLYEDDVVGMNFCPNCGAEMRGEEKSNQHLRWRGRRKAQHQGKIRSHSLVRETFLCRIRNGNGLHRFFPR